MRKIVPALFLIGVALCGCATPGGNALAPETQSSEAQSFGDYLSAKLAASDHNMADAARLYNASLAADPDNPDILSHAFLYSAASGDVDSAAKLAERLLKSQPDNRAARLALAVEDMKHGDYAAARREIEHSGKEAFTGLTFLLLDAWATAGAGDVKAAEANLVSVTKEGGTDTLTAFHRGLIEDLAGNAAAAEAGYKAALASGASSPRIAEAYGRFLERAGRTEDARAYYSKMQADAALEPIADQGLARLAAGEKPPRLVDSAAAGAAEALFGIAAALNDENSTDVAVFYLRLALFLAPDADLAKIVLADRFEAMNKFDDAIAVYRTLPKTSPYYAAAEVQVALDETKMDHNGQAIADLTALSESHPTDSTVWTALGDAYRNEEKFVAAADAYDHAVALVNADKTSSWPLYYARAIAEERSHQWNAAENDLKHALKLSPDEPQVLNYLGYSWVDQGRNLTEALSMLEKARSLSPTDGYIVDSVGWAYFRLGRYQDAVKALENAIQLVPGDTTVNAHLGDAYWKVGRKLDARYQWSHALAFGPDATAKAELEKKLSEGLVQK